MGSIDPEKLKTKAKLVFGALGGAMTSAMIGLGDRLGLYRAMAGAGLLTSGEHAAKTGLHERWVREWMYQQGAAGVLEHRGEGRFELSTEAAALLAEEAHPAFGAGFFSHLPQTLAVAERLPESFLSGVGLPYDAFGPEGARGIERGLGPWFRALLVPFVLPRLGDVVPPLQRGARAADVGCGAGVALLELAKAFPASEFHGYDISQHALARAEENRHVLGLTNAHFHDAASEPLPEKAEFDFVTTFDCLHDMTDPASVIGAIRRSLRDDGLWLVCDIKAHGSFEANVERNPMAAMMYGMSVMICMSSALSEAGGLGLGALGLHEALLREMALAAGFSRVDPIDFGHPVNAFYLVHP